MRKLKWPNHADLAIRRGTPVDREEYLDQMTFQANRRPLFTEIFGPIIGLKEEWEEQGATPEELDFSAFRYRDGQRGGVPVSTGWVGGPPAVVLEETEESIFTRDRMGRRMQALVMDERESIDIDTPVDLELCRVLSEIDRRRTCATQNEPADRCALQ